MLNNSKKTYGLDAKNLKQKIPIKSRFKIKWKTIQWLLIHKKGLTALILRCNKQFLWELQTDIEICSKQSKFLELNQKEKKELDNKDFIELLNYVGLGGDIPLAEKLFQFIKFSH